MGGIDRAPEPSSANVQEALGNIQGDIRDEVHHGVDQECDAVGSGLRPSSSWHAGYYTGGGHPKR